MRRGDYKRIKQHVGLIKKIHFFLLLRSFDATRDKLSFAYTVNVIADKVKGIQVLGWRITVVNRSW